MAGKGWTDPGRVNRHGQINLGRTRPRRPASDFGQSVYVMHCPVCVKNYGANGSDIFIRKCPYHKPPVGEKGRPGEPLQGDEADWRP